VFLGFVPVFWGLRFFLVGQHGAGYSDLLCPGFTRALRWSWSDPGPRFGSVYQTNAIACSGCRSGPVEGIRVDRDVSASAGGMWQVP